MSLLWIALLNLVLAMAMIAAVAYLVRLAHRLPARSHLEADIENLAEPLPLSLIVNSEREHDFARAAAA